MKGDPGTDDDVVRELQRWRLDGPSDAARERILVTARAAWRTEGARSAHAVLLSLCLSRVVAAAAGLALICGAEMFCRSRWTSGRTSFGTRVAPVPTESVFVTGERPVRIVFAPSERTARGAGGAARMARNRERLRELLSAREEGES
jgi:hypothetical protein